MKSLLLVLLAASLAANVVLAVRNRQPSTSATAASEPSTSAKNSVSSNKTATTGTAAATVASSASATAPTGPTPHVWKPVGSEGDLHRLVEDLRAAGYPPSVTRAIVNQLLSDRFASRQPGANEPFWKQGANTPESVAARNALNKERQALFESLLGADARPSAMMDEATRSRRYGALGDDKIDAIARIERDYGEMNAEAWAKRRNNSMASTNTTMQIQQLMEEEKTAELSAVLTPDELAQYEMRTSRSARTVMNNLRNLDVSESEFTRLYAAQTAFEAANPRSASMDATTFAQRRADQLILNEQAKSVLGDERFYSYLESADGNYANVAQALGKHAPANPATSYQVYQMQMELQSVLSQMSRSGQMSSDSAAQARSTVQSYNQQLEQLIGPEAAAAYRKEGSGRVFSAFRSGPSTPVMSVRP